MSDVFWAAFGGGAAAGLFTLLAVVTAEWLRWYVDRPLLRVSARLGQLATKGMAGGVEMSGKLLFLEAVNPHSQQVTVSSFGLSFKQEELGSLWISPQLQYPLPYQIGSGKSLSQWTSVAELLKSRREKGVRLVMAIALDLIVGESSVHILAARGPWLAHRGEDAVEQPPGGRVTAATRG